MLAIAQSGNTYHYLNWIPSESGPMVTHYGKIKKENKYPEKFKQHHYEILAEIISTIDIEEHILHNQYRDFHPTPEFQERRIKRQQQIDDRKHISDADYQEFKMFQKIDVHFLFRLLNQFSIGFRHF